MLASLLARHGVGEAVLSPGSRNAPLIVALERHPDINTHVVVDERSAGFIALGMAGATQGPVAMVCTSGTAPLNYAPAIAEAYYREIPLIAVTADRPEEWIDQDDSQTIIQPGIYNNFIKGTFDIQVESDDADRMWKINRSLNDAIILATHGRPGPVHINVRLADPLGDEEEGGGMDEYGDDARIISLEEPACPSIPDGVAEELSERLMPPAKVLVIAGFMAPGGMDAALRELSRRPNFVVMHEAQSNLHGYGDFIPNIDATLREVENPDEYPFVPDIAITIGGSLTSRMVKTWLRGLPEVEHWSVGEHGHSVDCFRRLSRRIPYHPWAVVSALALRIRKRNNSETTTFKNAWKAASEAAAAHAAEYAAGAPWSDFKAMAKIMGAMPHGWNLHLSNGTAVRYAQLFDYSRAATVSCNRGVSGIDGCTSTAIGGAVMSDVPTVLITGDMSMQYDIGALATTFIPTNFKIIVLNNGGGGIFRFIRSTRHLPELDRCFTADVRLPLKKLAAAYGFRYFSAESGDELEAAIKKLISSNTAPTILEVVTDKDVSAQTIYNYFNS